jgi:nicotinamide-nucleotide adenylyltransferase
VRRAAYIGRFQVFHLGHQDVLELMDRAPDVDGIAIVIGSAQYDHEHRHPDVPWSLNPFTVDERREMIERSLAGVLSKPWSIHPVPDTHDHSTWLATVFDRAPEFHVLYSSSRKEHVLFGAHGKEVRDFPKARSFHAGSIREQLARGERWQDSVPAGARAVLERIDAGARLRALVARDREERRIA